MPFELKKTMFHLTKVDTTKLFMTLDDYKKMKKGIKFLSMSLIIVLLVLCQIALIKQDFDPPTTIAILCVNQGILFYLAIIFISELNQN